MSGIQSSDSNRSNDLSPILNNDLIDASMTSSDRTSEKDGQKTLVQVADTTSEVTLKHLTRNRPRPRRTSKQIRTGRSNIDTFDKLTGASNEQPKNSGPQGISMAELQGKIKHRNADAADDNISKEIFLENLPEETPGSVVSDFHASQQESAQSLTNSTQSTTSQSDITIQPDNEQTNSNNAHENGINDRPPLQLHNRQQPSRPHSVQLLPISQQAQSRAAPQRSTVAFAAPPLAEVETRSRSDTDVERGSNQVLNKLSPTRLHLQTNEHFVNELENPKKNKKSLSNLETNFTEYAQETLENFKKIDVANENLKSVPEGDARTKAVKEVRNTKVRLSTQFTALSKQIERDDGKMSSTMDRFFNTKKKRKKDKPMLDKCQEYLETKNNISEISDGLVEFNDTNKHHLENLQNRSGSSSSSE